MDIGSIIMSLLERKKVPVAPEAVSGVAPEAPPTAPEAPPTAAPIAEAYKSPPDLMQMYMKSIEKSNKLEAMNRGMTLIAAGFAQPQNRASLISLASGIGGGSSGGPSMTELLALQKYQDERADMEQRRGNLPALMDQYGFSEAEIQYLDETGQLDEVLATLNNPETEVVEDAATGMKLLIDSRTGETIKQVGDAKPRATEYVKLGDGNQVLVYTDDRTRVDTGEKLTETGVPLGAIEYKELSNGTIQPMRDGVAFGEPIGPESETITTETLEDGTIQKFVNGVAVGGAFGPKKEKPITIEKLGNGQVQAWQNGKPISDPVGPETDVTPADVKTWQAVNADNVARGQPEEGLDEFLVRYRQSGTEAGTQADLDKTRYGNPPAGKFFIRDETGAVVTNPDGTPKTVWDTESKEYFEFQKSQREADEAALKTGKLEEKSAATGTRNVIKDTIQGQNVERALEMIEENKDSWVGVGGWGGLFGFVPESDQNEFNGLLWNIGNATGLKELQSMRDAAAESTGSSGLGQVTEGEHAMLRAVMGNLSPLGKPEVLRLNLRRIQAGMELIANGVHDPSSPNADNRGYRAPTEGEVQEIMAKIKDEEAAAVAETDKPFTDEDGVTFTPIAPVDPNAGVPTGN